ncbi:acetyl-CoA C-acetyltransferase [Vibrio lentus]|uniref:Acetyl-CoA acetyltransferase n=1 Tax=Vibrio lentus TaxID=136468 RepID=A0AB36XRC6_9VIBR|nr:acetyl-CoA C-acetyltransferase [Vibrio lentus]MCC4839082.1 acetyl-CoA C-acetyltransferase [Vibrio lentus]PMI11372.1 acetyl-CoA acetyltransferase [Vibrio lentus]PMK37865.1 acetyl-CoA acetyltransferase [Vibrio lentus]PMK49375.1 acetyl-CoA acetyltransferase [Vibrio lentus]PML31964.1 acetyl-CoA acetyltransferase [Vibrio lentus]
MEPIYIVAAKRTPIGSFNGALSSVSAPTLGAAAIRGAISQCHIDPTLIDEVIVGNVLGAGIGMGPGRQAAIQAGIPETVPAYTLNMICGSGMKTVMDAASHIKAGDAEIVVACGMESMSQAPFVQTHKVRSGVRMGNISLEDSIITDGLTDAFNQYHMGITAENIAESLSISREEQDAFALKSQLSAASALETHGFRSEIEPIEVSLRRKQYTIEFDEYPKANSTSESLARLRPAFKKDGTVTAGNASGINDGAAAIILASKSAVERYQLKPMAEIISYAQAGLSPEIMGLGPVPAIANALEKSDLSLQDIEYFELNEAFAAQAIGVTKQLAEQHNVEQSWILDRTNHNGGAIALGHPLGASGIRILVSLAYQLERKQQNYGLASLCIGGGMGTAVIIKRCA